MIDAEPSLRAATGVRLDRLQTYLAKAGWEAQGSRHGLSLLAKPLSGGSSVEVVLPATSAASQEVTRRVADVLRTIASLEGRSVFDIADEIGAPTLKPAMP
jgi:hypothetical protein